MGRVARVVDSYCYFIALLCGLVDVEHQAAQIEDTTRQPFAGIGKPEPLRHAMAGFWSRRITDEHRMVYRLEKDALLIAQLGYRY